MALCFGLLTNESASVCGDGMCSLRDPNCPFKKASISTVRQVKATLSARPSSKVSTMITKALYCILSRFS